MNPLRPAHRDPPASAPPGAEPGPPRRRILVIEDDTGVSSALGEVLELEGFDFACAPSGAAALEALQDGPVDLVLLDLNLQGKSGWDLLEHLYIRSPLVPVIVITAQPNQLLAAVCTGVGALLEKPLRIPILLETIESLLAESEEVRRLRRCGEPIAFRYSTPSGGLVSVSRAVPRMAITTAGG